MRGPRAVVSASESSATFEMAPSEYTKAMWDKPFRCRFTVTVTATSLDTEYAVENTSTNDVFRPRLPVGVKISWLGQARSVLHTAVVRRSCHDILLLGCFHAAWPSPPSEPAPLKPLSRAATGAAVWAARFLTWAGIASVPEARCFAQEASLLGAAPHFQAALHSYFDVSSIQKVAIGGSVKGKKFLNKMVTPPVEQVENRDARAPGRSPSASNAMTMPTRVSGHGQHKCGAIPCFSCVQSPALPTPMALRISHNPG